MAQSSSTPCVLVNRVSSAFQLWQPQKITSSEQLTPNCQPSDQQSGNLVFKPSPSARTLDSPSEGHFPTNGTVEGISTAVSSSGHAPQFSKLSTRTSWSPEPKQLHVPTEHLHQFKHCIWANCKHCGRKCRTYVKIKPSATSSSIPPLDPSRHYHVFCRMECKLREQKQIGDAKDKSASAEALVVDNSCAVLPEVVVQDNSAWEKAAASRIASETKIDPPKYKVGDIVASRSGKGDWKRAGVVGEVYFSKFVEVQLAMIWLRPKAPSVAKKAVEQCFQMCHGVNVDDPNFDLEEHRRKGCTLYYHSFRFQHNAKLPVGANLVDEKEILCRLCIKTKRIYRPKEFTTIKLTPSPILNTIRGSASIYPHDAYTVNVAGRESPDVCLTRRVRVMPRSTGNRSNGKQLWTNTRRTRSQEPSWSTVFLNDTLSVKQKLRTTLLRARKEVLDKEENWTQRKCVPPLLLAPRVGSKFGEFDIFCEIHRETIAKAQMFHKYSCPSEAIPSSLQSIAHQLFSLLPPTTIARYRQLAPSVLYASPAPAPPHSSKNFRGTKRRKVCIVNAPTKQ